MTLSGCSLFQSKTEYVKVSYPVLICPEPPLVERPNLFINELTMDDRENYKKVAQYYDITLQQLTHHISVLETILERYNKTSVEYKKIQDEFEQMTIKPEEAEEKVDKDGFWSF
jgi:hypothetical protein